MARRKRRSTLRAWPVPLYPYSGCIGDETRGQITEVRGGQKRDRRLIKRERRDTDTDLDTHTEKGGRESQVETETQETVARSRQPENERGSRKKAKEELI